MKDKKRLNVTFELHPEKNEAFQISTMDRSQGWYHTVALPFTFFIKKVNLSQKTNYGNSNISPFKNRIFKKKILQKKPKSFMIS
jgi:hypothetical protein